MSSSLSLQCDDWWVLHTWMNWKFIKLNNHIYMYFKLIQEWYRKSGWLWTCQEKNIFYFIISYCIGFPRLFSHILLRQYINIINDYNLLTSIIYVVLYVFLVFFWNTLKSVNFEVVKLSRIGGERTIKSPINRFNNKWGCLGQTFISCPL